MKFDENFFKVFFIFAVLSLMANMMYLVWYAPEYNTQFFPVGFLLVMFLASLLFSALLNSIKEKE